MKSSSLRCTFGWRCYYCLNHDLCHEDYDGEEEKKSGKISDLDRILVSAGNDLDGVQALERAQLGEDLPHGDRLGEVEDYVALSWAYIIIDCYPHH